MADLENHLERQAEDFADFFWHRLRWRAVRSQLPRSGPFALLDVGAGAGLLGEYLAAERPDADYWFNEPIESLNRRLAGRFGADHELERPCPGLGIGYVTVLDVVEHVDDDHAFLAELIDGLDPGTTVIVTVPALARLWSQWDIDLGHHRRYDRASMRRLLEALPVDEVEISYLFPEMVPAGLWRTRRPPRHDHPTFPDLPAWANQVLYGVGVPTVLARRLAPLGTSVFAVARTR